MNARAVAIVDDDPAMGVALTRLTRSLGYEPALFASAESFLAALDGTRPDCVVTDVQMPGMSGLDLLRVLKEQKPELPVILITAYPSGTNSERAITAGAFAFLTKPFDADDLEECLASVFGSH